MLIQVPSNTQQFRIFGDCKIFDPTELVFHQDNAPVHKKEAVRKLVAQKQWEMLDWPVYSPDLNHIRNLWAN